MFRAFGCDFPGYPCARFRILGDSGRMSRLGLGSVLRSAKLGGYAVPACNVFDAVGMDAVLAAGERLSSPVVVQVSTRALRAWGPARLWQLFAALVAQRQPENPFLKSSAEEVV
ncbi:class II fructose-bisphosphate aldolase [Streptomyces canus]|uniref:class II fructose-bisphosphate aldolase n=2 Tax=Streptomyces canus TaxID=58343 RepID=UPI00386B4AF4